MSNPGGVNLNIGPYFDDYDEDKKYVRVLYRPGRAVQARELTQAQTYQQKQIQRFAEYFFNEGAVIDGCDQNLDLRMEFVKLQTDFGPSGNTVEVDVDDFLNKEIVGANTGIKAFVGLASDIEGEDPKTLFINYTSSGSVILNVDATGAFITLGNTVTFNSGNTGIIKAFYQDPLSSVFRVYVSGLVGEPDPVPFTANSVGSDGAVFTMNVGSVSDKRNSTKFENSERLFVLIDDIVDSPNTDYANTATSRATFFIQDEGLSTERTYNYGSKFTLGTGTLYIADHFVKHDAQTIILDKYKNNPSYKIGIIPTKTFIDTVDDQTLLDNAQGTPNFQALGADRFRIDTLLTKLVLNVNTAETEFVTITEVDNGALRRQFVAEVQNKLEEAISRRTFEESGNYTISDPKIFVREHLKNNDTPKGKFLASEGGNNQLLVIETDPFVSYVKGYRNELLAKVFTPLKKGIDTQFVEQVKTSIAVGNYVSVKELVGSWNFMESTKVDLYDTAQQAISNTSFSSTTLLGSKIGEARVRAVQYSNGTPGQATATYNMYLYDVVMNTEKLFQDVRSIYDSSGGGLPDRYADIVLDSRGNAVFRDVAFEPTIFEIPYEGIKTLRDENNNVESGYQFRKEFAANFNGSGEVTIATTDLNETFASGLTESLKNANYIVIPTNTANTSTLTGTANVTSGSATLSSLPGSTTAFLTEFEVGDVIRIGSQDRIISSITNNFVLTVSSNFTTTLASNTISKVFSAGRPIRLSGIGSTGVDRSVTLGTPPQTVSIDLKEQGLQTTSGSGFAARVVTTMDRANAREVRKTLNAGTQVQINANIHPSGLIGPYGLGYGDVYQINAIYQSSGFGVPATTSNTNVTLSYTLDNGQRDTTYEHGSITPKSGVIPTGNLLVVFDHFTHDTSQGIGYLSLDSYPVNDTVSSNTTIRTEEIPIYESVKNGFRYDLRNCLDFRFIKSANTTGTNPLDTEIYQIPAGGLHFPTPGSDFDADLIYFKGRKAKLFIDNRGELGINDGSPGYPFSSPPATIPDTLELGEISIPVYPSLPKDIIIETYKNKRFTMRDIGKLQKRVEKLEYYATLSELEKQASGKVVIDEDGFDKFKNGILVDNFEGHNIGDVLSPDYRVAIDRAFRYATAYANNQVQIGLRYNSTGSSGVIVTPGKKVMLSYTEEEFLNQPYASGVINLAQELTFSWIGDIEVFPATDNWLDVSFPPEANSTVDLTGFTDNWRNLVDAWNTEISPLSQHWVGTDKFTATGSIVEGTRRVNPAIAGAFIETRRDLIMENQQLFESRAEIDIAAEEVNSVVQRVSDISLKHYIRSRDFVFNASGLKDNAQLYAFFDEIDVTSNCRQIRLAAGVDIEDLEFDNNGRIISDAAKFTEISTGTLRVENNKIVGFFRVPGEAFFVGQREFKLTDDSQNRSSAETTYTKTSIFAQGLSIVKGFDIVNTRPFTFKGITDQRVEGPGSTRTTFTGDTVDVNVPVGRRDPISQSFYVDEILYPQGIFVTSIDLFFRSKSSDANLGATVEIREMSNGFPTRRIIGNEVARRENAQINTSTNGSVATNFVFKNPIYLPPAAEYCFTAKPDGNSTEFEIFIAELGQLDISSTDISQRIDKQPSSGVLFTSSNDYTWSVRQNQDVKFKLNLGAFSTSTTGVAVLQNIEYADTTNFTYTSYIPNVETLIIPKTGILLESRTHDTAFTASTFDVIKNLEKVQVNSLRLLANTTNENSNIPTAKSITIRANLSTENRYITPYIDLQRMNVALEKIIINNDTFFQLTGTATWQQPGNNIVVGSSTDFDNELSVGEYVLFGEEYRQITTIANSVYLEVKDNFTANGSGVTLYSQNEENPTGPYASETRYITRRIELNDGFESSDIAAYVNVNRQPGTDIKVYYKVLSDSDNDPFDFKFYEEMALDGSAETNQNSLTYKEEKYIIPAAKKTGGSRLLDGSISITSGSADVVGTGTVFLEQLRVGDTIAVGTSRIQRIVSAISNNTFLSTETTFATTASGQELYKILNNSVGYTTPDGRSFSGFKYFAIKIVFLSTNSAFAPKIKNFRVIALA